MEGRRPDPCGIWRVHLPANSRKAADVKTDGTDEVKGFLLDHQRSRAYERLIATDDTETSMSPTVTKDFLRMSGSPFSSALVELRSSRISECPHLTQ